MVLWEVCFNGFARMKNSDVGVSLVKAGGDARLQSVMDHVHQDSRSSRWSAVVEGQEIESVVEEMAVSAPVPFAICCKAG
jgi:hypothetical protein